MDSEVLKMKNEKLEQQKEALDQSLVALRAEPNGSSKTTSATLTFNFVSSAIFDLYITKISLSSNL